MLASYVHPVRTRQPSAPPGSCQRQFGRLTVTAGRLRSRPGGAMSPARVAVVMLAHGKAAYLERALASVAAEAGVALEIVVVDNGSGPEVG